MVEKKVYNSWAFSSNESEKAKINMEIYKELTSEYKIFQAGSGSYNIDDYDLVYTRTPGYNHAIYTIIKNETKTNTSDLLLIFDDGNLCFGGSHLGGNRYRVSED